MVSNVGQVRPARFVKLHVWPLLTAALPVTSSAPRVVRRRVSARTKRQPQHAPSVPCASTVGTSSRCRRARRAFLLGAPRCIRGGGVVGSGRRGGANKSC